MIKAANAGVQVDDVDCAGFVKACEQYIVDAELRRSQGKNSLRTFSETYERSVALVRLVKLVTFES